MTTIYQHDMQWPRDDIEER